MTTINSFDDMGLKEDILRGIYAYGMEEPSSIQKKAIKGLMRLLNTFSDFFRELSLILRWLPKDL